jgi:hypothetical protein
VLAFLLRWVTARRVRTYPIIAAAVILATGIAQAVSSPGAPWNLWGGDFRAFYAAGAFLRDGRADLLYDPAAQAAFQAQALAGKIRDEVSLWLAPPFAAWPFVPLSHLPFAMAFAVQSAIGIAAAGAAFVLLHRELYHPLARKMAWAAIGYYPTLQWFSQGQLTSWSLLLFTTAFVALRRGNDGIAGALVGCLAYKPQLAMGWLFALAGARRFRALVAALVSGLGWGVVSYVTLPAATREYLERAPGFDALLRADGYPTAGLHGLHQAAALLLDAFARPLGTAVGILLTILACGTLVALWARQPWNPGRPEWDRRMAATLALSVIASPHLFSYDLMLLLLPFFILWHLYPEGTRGKPLDGGPLLALTALGWALSLLGPALTVGQQMLTRWMFGRAFAVQLGVIAIAAWAWLLARTPQKNSRINMLNANHSGEPS